MSARISDFLDGWSKIDHAWILTPWEKACKNIAPLRAVDTLLRSCGQVIFADHPLTGLFMLLAMAMVSWAAFLFACTGAAISSLFAFALNKDRHYIQKGIFGFNGAILGIFWSWYFLVSTPSFALFILMLLLTSAVQSAMMYRLSYGHFNLPVMSLPAAFTLIASLVTAYWLVFNVGIISPGQMYLSAQAPLTPLIPFPCSNAPGFWGIVATHKLHVWTMIFVGILINSRISFAVAVLFTLTGLAFMTILPPAWTNRGSEIFIGFNILPLSIALSGLFMPFCRMSFLYTGLAVLVCFVLWIPLSYLLAILHLPFLTLPFNVTVLLMLLYAKKNPSQMVTVPLDLVTTPEQILKLEISRRLSNSPTWRDLRRVLLGKRGQPKISCREADRFIKLMDEAQRISILSGAGTSTESGIPDFRGNASFWKAFGTEDFTYRNFLTRSDIQARYWAMERQFQALVSAAEPSHLHKAVRELDGAGKLECVVTQNIDGLFQKAGLDSSRVLEIHGTAHHVQCLNCGTVFPRQEIELSLVSGISVPSCRVCHGLLKPMTVLMGEDISRSVLEEALDRICRSDLLIVIGTSLQVEPVASIPDVAWQKGVKIVMINLDPTPKDHLATMVLRQTGSKLFKAVLRHAPR